MMKRQQRVLFLTNVTNFSTWYIAYDCVPKTRKVMNKIADLQKRKGN